MRQVREQGASTAVRLELTDSPPSPLPPSPPRLCCSRDRQASRDPPEPRLPIGWLILKVGSVRWVLQAASSPPHTQPKSGQGAPVKPHVGAVGAQTWSTHLLSLCQNMLPSILLSYFLPPPACSTKQPLFDCSALTCCTLLNSKYFGCSTLQLLWQLNLSLYLGHSTLRQFWLLIIPYTVLFLLNLHLLWLLNQLYVGGSIAI